MEETKTETASVSSKMKVLAIGDEEEDSTDKPSPPEYNLHVHFPSYMALIMLDTRKPIEVVGDWNLIGRFGAAVRYENKIPKSYCFYYNKDRSFTPDMAEGSIINGPVFSGREILDEVKKQFSNEKWTSTNEISAPLNKKLYKNYDNSYYFIQQTVSAAIDTEKKRLLNYLLFLHREHVKNSK